MKKTGKIISILLAVTMLFVLAACGGGGSNATQAPAADTQAAETQAAAGDATEAAPEESEAAADTQAAAPSGDAITLRIGCGTAGAHPQNVYMEALKPAIEEATGGQIEVQLLPAGQYGNMIELIQGLRDGTVESSVIPVSYYANTYMGATVIDIPGTFTDSIHAYEVLSKNDTLYSKGFEEAGILPISYIPLFERTILTKTKIESMSDLAALKMWTIPSAVIQKELELTGCTVSNLDMGEVSPSLQNGTIDGVFTDKLLYLSQKLFDSAKYYTPAPNDAMLSVFAISPAWVEKNNISDELLQTITDVSKEVADTVMVPYMDEMNASVEGAMSGAQVEVVEPSDDIKAGFDQIAEDVKAWYFETYPEYQEIYDELVSLAK